MSILTFMNGYNYNFNRTCNPRNSSRLKNSMLLPSWKIHDMNNISYSRNTYE